MRTGCAVAERRKGVAGGTVKAPTNGKLILGVPDTAGKCYRASTADTVTSWIEWAKIHGAPSIPAAYDSAGHAGISDSSKKYDNRYQATLTNPVTGAGTSGFFPLWSGTTTLGNSVAKQISTIDVTVKANFADTGNTYISGFLGIGQAPSSNYGALINQTSTYTGSVFRVCLKQKGSLSTLFDDDVDDDLAIFKKSDLALGSCFFRTAFPSLI